MHVSHETIYQSLFAQGRGELRRELARCLRSGRTSRRARGRVEKRGSIPDMVMLSERPAEIEDRAVPGHWESQCRCQAALSAVRMGSVGDAFDCDDGVVLVEHAERVAQPKEVEDAPRTDHRHLRLHRGVLHSPASPLVARLRLTRRVRTGDEGTTDRLISHTNWVTKPSAGQSLHQTQGDSLSVSERDRLLPARAQLIVIMDTELSSEEKELWQCLETETSTLMSAVGVSMMPMTFVLATDIRAILYRQSVPLWCDLLGFPRYP